jgi:hypothetical protein
MIKRKLLLPLLLILFVTKILAQEHVTSEAVDLQQKTPLSPIPEA